MKFAFKSFIGSILTAFTPVKVPPVATILPLGHKFPDEHHGSPDSYRINVTDVYSSIN